MYPTPTPIPHFSGVPKISIDAGDWRIWNFTDEVINVWNYYPNAGTVIQIAIIVVLVVAFVVLLRRLIAELQNEGAE